MSKYGGYQDNPLLAEMYDLVQIYANRPDIGFYTSFCRETTGTILEIGCGTGRILMPAAAAGARITGLDLSGNMLSQCRKKLRRLSEEVQSRVNLVEADAVNFKLDHSFSLVIFPFRVFQHLTTVADQMACLKNVNRHMEKGGRLVFDVFQVNLNIITDPNRMKETEDVPEFELADGRRMRRTNRAVSVHTSEQISDVEIIYYVTEPDGNITRAVLAFPFRYFFRYEIEHLLARCGFEVVDIFGNFDRSPLKDDSPEIIFVCEKFREAE